MALPNSPPGNFTLNKVRLYISYDKSLLKEFISTILINASHLSGVVRDRFYKSNFNLIVFNCASKSISIRQSIKKINF